MRKMRNSLCLMLLSALLLLTVACTAKDDPQEPSVEGGIVIDFGSPTDPSATGELALLQDQLMVVDARLSNPYSAESKTDLLREYATVFVSYLQQPETMTMTPEQLVGDGYVLCTQASSIGVTAGTLRLLEYGSPDEAVFFALQYQDLDGVHAINIHELYSSDVMVANNSAACLVQDEELWVLLINEYKDGGEVWYNPVVYRGESADQLILEPLNKEMSRATQDYVLETQLVESGIRLCFVDFENNEIGGCELKVVGGKAEFTSW